MNITYISKIKTQERFNFFHYTFFIQRIATKTQVKKQETHCYCYKPQRSRKIHVLDDILVCFLQETKVRTWVSLNETRLETCGRNKRKKWRVSGNGKSKKRKSVI
jgi:hypothetical protein